MKKIIIILFVLIVLVGCNSTEKFYLSDKYYNNNELNSITVDEVEKLINEKDSFVLYTYNNYCTLPISCEDIFTSFIESNNISFNSLSFSELKESSIYEEVKYAPSIIIFKEGKIIDYLDANADKDLNKYQDEDEFTEWISNYIYLVKK